MAGVTTRIIAAKAGRRFRGSAKVTGSMPAPQCSLGGPA